MLFQLDNNFNCDNLIEGNKVSDAIARLQKTVKDSLVPQGFIKVTDQPVKALSSEQKALLNRKGNILFNEGKYSEATRIFITTGYSDGLTRIGDIYYKQQRCLDALKYYVLAHNMAKAEPLYEKAAQVLSALLRE